MSLMYPGVGDIGTVVTGKSTPARVEGNGGNAVLATIDIPSAGVWIVCASGWLPISGKQGYAALLNGVSSLCATDTGTYQFSMSGILSASSATQVKLQYTSWDTVAHDNTQIPGLIFKAVKVGGA
mgnify:FL=1